MPYMASRPLAKRALYHFQSQGQSLEGSLNLIAHTIYAEALNPVVVTFARKIVEHCGMSYICRVQSVYKWLKERFVYRDDPLDRDSFKTPSLLIHEYWYTGSMKGDCDDATILAGAILKALHFPLRIIGVSSGIGPNAEIDHVALGVVLPNGKELYFDLTIDYDPNLKNRRVLKSDII